MSGARVPVRAPACRWSVIVNGNRTARGHRRGPAVSEFRLRSTWGLIQELGPRILSKKTPWLPPLWLGSAQGHPASSPGAWGSGPSEGRPHRGQGEVGNRTHSHRAPLHPLF